VAHPPQAGARDERHGLGTVARLPLRDYAGGVRGKRMRDLFGLAAAIMIGLLTQIITPWSLWWWAGMLTAGAIFVFSGAHLLWSHFRGVTPETPISAPTTSRSLAEVPGRHANSFLYKLAIFAVGLMVLIGAGYVAWSYQSSINYFVYSKFVNPLKRGQIARVSFVYNSVDFSLVELEQLGLKNITFSRDNNSIVYHVECIFENKLADVVVIGSTAYADGGEGRSFSVRSATQKENSIAFDIDPWSWGGIIGVNKEKIVFVFGY
jgi:hypothetical protein